MVAKLDWSLQKLRFYVFFSLTVLSLIPVAILLKYLNGLGDRNIQASLGWIAVGSLSIFLFSYSMYHLGTTGMLDDARALSVAWFWQNIARAVKKIYLNHVYGHELGAGRYLQLDSGKSQIRLVTILPGEERDPIECTLNYTVLGPNSSIYEALSYTWGSSCSLRSITLDGTPFHVTKNLDVALRNLRLPCTPRLVWIDAICINQEDDAERREQVQIMRRIYTQAKQVLVWLGEASSHSETAMEFLKKGNDKYDTKEWFKETVIETTEGLYRSEWQAIFHLQKRNYWSRTWIVQELACAARLELMCGSRSVSWETFISCLSAWYDLGHNASHDALRNSMAFIQAPTTDAHLAKMFLVDDLLDPWKSPQVGAAQFEYNRIALHTSVTPRHLAKFMFNHRKSQATDGRDKIYAFAGVSSDCQFPPLPIDYSLSTWAVYLKTLEYLLENTGRLDMITYSGIGQQGLGRPTWAPVFYWAGLQRNAFNYRSKQLFGSVGSGDFAASKDTKAKAKFISCQKYFDRPLGIDRTLLQVEGICVDVISRKLLHPQTNSAGGLELGVDLKSRRKYCLSSSAWMRTEGQRYKLNLIKIIFHFAMETPSPSHIDEGKNATRKERTEEFLYTLTCGRTAAGLRAPEEWSEAFAVLMAGPSQVPAAYEPQSSTPNVLSSIERARSFVGPFLSAIENTHLSGFFLFLTEKGRLGIANTNAKVGDRICVIPGCNMPLAIRPNSPQEEDMVTATVHGSVYLHYYMDGKAIDDLEVGSLSLTKFSLK